MTYLYLLMRTSSEPSLLWTELSQLFSLFSRPLIILMALGYIIFGNSIFLLHWGDRTWTHNSSCGLTISEERKDPFPQPQGNVPPSAAQDIAIHLCHRDLLLLNWESIRCPRSFPAKLLSSQWPVFETHGILATLGGSLLCLEGFCQ